LEKSRLTRIGYSAAGGAAAFLIGYFLALGMVALASSVVPGTPGAGEAASAMRRDIFSIAGLVYLASHTAALTGATNGETLTINPPFTLFGLIPVIALVLGGYIAAWPFRGGSAWKSALSGALIAPFYVFLALILRPFFTVDMTPYQDVQLGPFALPPVTLGAAFLSALWYSAIFAVVFGGLGGMRTGLSEGWLRGLVTRSIAFPGWLRGALAAFIVAQVAFTLVLIVLVGEMLIMRRAVLLRHNAYQPAAVAGFALAPTAAGIGYYFLQGARIEAGSATDIGESGLSTRVSADIFFGAREVTTSRLNGVQVESQRLPLPSLTYLGLAFIGLVFFVAGQIAARTSTSPQSGWRLALGIALAHIALLLLLAPLYSASIATTWQAAEQIGRTVISYGFALWSLLIFPFIVAFVFSLIGTLTAPRPREQY
jgi:hypothetical protein